MAKARAAPLVKAWRAAFFTSAVNSGVDAAASATSGLPSIPSGHVATSRGSTSSASAHDRPARVRWRGRTPAQRATTCRRVGLHLDRARWAVPRRPSKWRGFDPPRQCQPTQGHRRAAFGVPEWGHTRACRFRRALAGGPPTICRQAAAGALRSANVGSGLKSRRRRYAQAGVQPLGAVAQEGRVVVLSRRIHAIDDGGM